MLPSHSSRAPACGWRTPPWRSHTPGCPAASTGDRRPSRSRDRSGPSAPGRGRRSPPPRSAPSASPAATRQPTAAAGNRCHDRQDGSCSSRNSLKKLSKHALILSGPPYAVKSDRLLDLPKSKIKNLYNLLEYREAVRTEWLGAAV